MSRRDTTPPWSDGQRPVPVRFDWSVPISVELSSSDVLRAERLAHHVVDPGGERRVGIADRLREAARVHLHAQVIEPVSDDGVVGGVVRTAALAAAGRSSGRPDPS